MPEVQDIEQILRTTAILGLGFVFAAGALFLLLYLGYVVVLWIRDMLAISKTWIPKVAGAHVSFLDDTRTFNERTTVVLERMDKRQTDHADACEQTHKLTERIASDVAQLKARPA